MVEVFFFFFFFVALGFEIRTSQLLGRHSYHLNHCACPEDFPDILSKLTRETKGCLDCSNHQHFNFIMVFKIAFSLIECVQNVTI
jgi:hypothetical protein